MSQLKGKFCCMAAIVALARIVLVNQAIAQHAKQSQNRLFLYHVLRCQVANDKRFAASVE
jgi:hypothetical protein